MASEQDKPNKVLIGVLAILLGAFGIHKFMLGITTPGVIMLLVSTVGCVIGGSAGGRIVGESAAGARS